MVETISLNIIVFMCIFLYVFVDVFVGKVLWRSEEGAGFSCLMWVLGTVLRSSTRSALLSSEPINLQSHFCLAFDKLKGLWDILKVMGWNWGDISDLLQILSVFILWDVDLGCFGSAEHPKYTVHFGGPLLHSFENCSHQRDHVSAFSCSPHCLQDSKGPFSLRVS